MSSIADMGISATSELFGKLSSGQPVYLFTLVDHESRISVNIVSIFVEKFYLLNPVIKFLPNLNYK